MTKDELLSIISFLDTLRSNAMTGLGLHAPDPYWNLTLYIMRRHLEGKPATVTSLAASALVPYASAMRRIDEMVETGLIFKRPRTASGRSFSVHPTPDLISRFEASMTRVKMLVARTFGRNPDDDLDGTFYFGGSYMGVRLVASPDAMKPPIGRVKPMRVLVQDDPTFQVLGRFLRELEEWLGGKIELAVMPIDAMREETLANAHRLASAYDIVAIDMPWMGEYAAKQVLLPLSELVTKGRVNLSDFHPASWQGANFGGVQYGIPIQTMPELLFYRTDLIEQYRLTPPASTAQLLDAARELTSPLRDRYGVAWCGRRGTPIAHSFMQFMGAFGGPPLRLPWENGDYFLHDLTKGTLRPAFDTPIAEATAEFMLHAPDRASGRRSRSASLGTAARHYGKRVGWRRGGLRPVVRLMGPRSLQRGPGAALGPANGPRQSMAAGSAPAAPIAPAKLPPPPGPARTLVVERRDLATADRPRLKPKPKPDAAVQLREVAAVMRNLPRDCLIDRAELFILMRRLAGRLMVIADTGMEVTPAYKARAPRQPFMLERRTDARTVAEAVFGKGRSRSDQRGSVTSRKGRTVPVEIRRARAAGQYEISF